MASVNRVILVGNLGRDPEVRYAPSGDAITNVAIATTDQWKDKNGEKQERTEWHRVVFFGKLADIAGEYLAKGSQVYIEGSLRTRKWTDQQGVEKYTTEIVADRMQMLGRKGDGKGDGNGDSQQRSNGNSRQRDNSDHHSRHENGDGEKQRRAQEYRQQTAGGGNQRKAPPPQNDDWQNDWSDDIPF